MAKAKFFGFWITVADQASAAEAVRMAGLPSLVMGANALLLGLMEIVRQAPNTLFAAVFGFLGLLLVVVSFRIRAGHGAWIPLVAIVFFVFLADMAASSVRQWFEAAQAPVLQAKLVTGWIVPLFCLALAVSGIMGWNWLRRHGGRLSF